MREKILEDSGILNSRGTVLVSTERSIQIPSLPSAFISNKISTSKYNCMTFLPKNLWYQFHKLANVYFLIIAVLQLIPEISVSGGVPTIMLPLTMVLTISAIKDLLEDRKRKKSDNEENSRKCLKMDKRWGDVQWQHIRVGDVIKVRKDQYFPADLVLISSSEPKGICYVETKNLDGETNLKHKLSNKQLLDYFADETALAEFRGTVRCEGANPMIYHFNGVFTIGNELQVPLSADQFLLRGSSLKNTDWAIGLVVYTGHESKIMLNSSNARNKFSQLETRMNRQIVYIFLMQISLCTVCALYYAIWFSNNDSQQYLELAQDQFHNPFTVFILMFFSWMLIFTNFVPISLLVTLEMVKFFQALFIEQDLSMYYEPTDTPTEVHSSNLNEELGQVHYVFSDKTGTLTCNVMEFRKCSILGRAYGTDSRMAFSKVPNVDFVDGSFNISEGKNTEFFLSLAICHTVIAENTNNSVEYKASSPDELALVNAAKFFGVTFVSRDIDQNMLIQMPDGREISVALLNVLEFNSDRKRMSVIVRMPDLSIRLICKGADSVLLPRIIKTNIIGFTFDHLETFGNEGLRTLLIAQKEISESVYENWNSRHQLALKNIHQREERLDELAEEIEKDMLILGATAIEDKLQDNVPETIENLRTAGIKVWVLTGDKIETAVNIGFSCHLLEPAMVRLEVIANKTVEVKRELKEAVLSIKAAPEKDFALIIAGEALIRASRSESQSELMHIIDYCKVVLACRVSPQQKADLVTLIRKTKPEISTLSIGDGANDVNMILAAHVGIGISGLEGRQAVRASDFAVSQFSYLQRLMFVHGRESYRKNATLICYNFYKNVMLVFPLFFYGLFSVYSGQSLYNPWSYQLFNVTYAALPIILYAIFDQEIRYELLESDPRNYRLGFKGKLFSSLEFWGWILEGVIFGFIVCIVSIFSICEVTGSAENGYISSMWVGSCMIGSLVVILVNLKVLAFSYVHHWFTILVVVLSVGSYYLVSFFLTEILPIEEWLQNYGSTGSTLEMFLNVNFYVGSVLVVFVFLIYEPFLRVLRDYKRLHKRKSLEESYLSTPTNVKDDYFDSKLGEEELHRAQEALQRFSHHHTGFAYSEAPGQTPQITNPRFNYHTIQSQHSIN